MTFLENRSAQHRPLSDSVGWWTPTPAQSPVKFSVRILCVFCGKLWGRVDLLLYCENIETQQNNKMLWNTYLGKDGWPR